MRIKTILFDLDGTILNSINTIYKSTYKSVKELNLPPLKRRQIKENIHTSLETAFKEVYPDHCHKLEEAKKSFFRNYLRFFKKSTKEIPGSISAIKKLKGKGIKIAIVTTRTKVLAKRVIKHFRIPHDVLVTCEDTTRIRPDPEPLKKAMNELKTKPSETIYVGDTPQDIKQGKNANVITIGVTSGLYSRQELAQEKPDFLIGDVSEIPESLWEK